ncbi:TolC family protein [Haliscomenobacter sp.]|uniref:TolC family protein n=1 Tax=Haliscomenobacter sp. TaxID=2717303 RepID=UPI003364C640
MLNKITILNVIFLLVYGNTQLKAQGPRKLSLSEAVSLGLQNSKVLQISSAKLEAIHARVTQIKNQLLPSVNLSTNYTRISNNVTPFTVRFSPSSPEVVLNPQILNQSYNRIGIQYGIFTGSRAVNTLKSTEFLEKASILDAEKDKAEVRLNLLNAYFSYSKLRASKQVLDENLKTLDSRLTDTRNFFNQGLALQNDVLKLELTQASYQQNLADVQAAIDINNFNLCLLLGLPTETQIETEQNALEAKRDVLATQTFIDEALQNRPELKAMNFRKLAGERAVEISRGNYFPVISLGANYDYNLPNQRIFPQENAFKGTWAIGLTATYNLVNLYATKALIEEQKANLAQTQYQQLYLTSDIKMEVNAQVLTYQTALQKITLAQKSIDQAKENQRIMNLRYNSQVATLTELLEADGLNTQAQLNLVNAQIDAELAYAKLQKSIGQ